MTQRPEKPSPAKSAGPQPPPDIDSRPLQVTGPLDEDNPLANVPENELRSLAPSDGTGVTGTVSQPEPQQPPPATAP